jgi:hypothetical protein
MKVYRMGAKVFQADEQKDRQDEANSRFSQFCEIAYKLVPALITLSRIGRLSLTVNITGTGSVLFTYLGLSTVLISTI